jgi:hypothetical protein
MVMIRPVSSPDSMPGTPSITALAAMPASSAFSHQASDMTPFDPFSGFSTRMGLLGKQSGRRVRMGQDAEAVFSKFNAQVRHNVVVFDGSTPLPHVLTETLQIKGVNTLLDAPLFVRFMELSGTNAAARSGNRSLGQEDPNLIALVPVIFGGIRDH